MPQMTISRLMTIFAILVTLGLVTALGIQTYTIKRVQIEGPLYDGIQTQQNLLADLMPPPLFAVEAYAAVYEANFHADRRARAIKKIHELKNLYDERKALWEAADLPPAEVEVIKRKLIPASDRFWFVTFDQFLPAVGKKYETMMAIMDDLARAYTDQLEAVTELSALAQQLNSQNEQSAASEASMLGTSALIGGLAAVLVFLLGIVTINLRAIRPLSSISNHMERLATGDNHIAIPFKGRFDEIGMIARALDVFRIAGIEKLHLEKRTEAATEEQNKERVLRDEEAQARASQVGFVVDQLGGALRGLSKSNLTVEIDGNFGPEFEQIREDFNNSISSLAYTLERVSLGTQNVRHASEELSSGADDMSRRSEQQAAALEQASAALEEITATIENLNQNTRETRRLVAKARSRAEESTTVMKDAIDAMQRIEKSASEITEIIGVIDEIAFQTNLLALNAGVEAARAGESGKGFAVVASEVRDLAQRSASAARQIKSLISNSTREVGDGVRRVGETGRALTEITAFVASIDEKVDGIVIGIQEQTAGLRETSSAIHSLDHTTQQNAAMAEETAAMSADLTEQAAALSMEVRKFKLHTSDRARSVSAHDFDRQVA